MSTDEAISAKILTGSEQKDICILELAYPVSLTALKLNSKDFKQGDAVYAVGYPAAADILSETEAHTSSEATITDGIVSAIRQNKVTEYGTPVELLQINAAINSGNSGGPLFNEQGEVVGINTFGVFDSQGIFGSISVAELENMMTENGIEVMRNLKGISTELVYVGASALIGCAIVVIAIIMGKRRMKKKAASKPAETLKAYLQSRAQPLPPNEAVALLMPIAMDLKNFHEAGIAHLEVAPERILVTQGIAKLAERTGTEANKYASGFCAPEIYCGKNYGARADIYSFCAILQYAITGIQPENALARNERAQEETEEAIWDFTEEIQVSGNKELLDITARGMQLNADERFATMQELIYMLTLYNLYSGATTEKAVFSVETPAEPQSSFKKKSKFKARIWIPAGVATAIILFAGTYYGCYLKAVSLAENGNFSNAEKYLFIKPLTALHDEKLSVYLDAGIEFENRQYFNAQKGFQYLMDYRNSRDMAKESKYRYAAQLADSDEFLLSIMAYKYLAYYEYKDSKDLVLETRYRKAVYDFYELGEYSEAYEELSALSKEGLSKADDMCNEVQYCWALDFAEKGNYIAAYNKLQGISGYADVNTKIALLREVIYLEGQRLYYDEDYYKAKTMFACISPYKKSGDYLTLISAHITFGYGSGKTADEIVSDLIDIFYFEDAADLLVSAQRFAEVFLEGTWKTSDGKYHFTMDSTGGVSYNLPWIDYGDYYYIEDGDYFEYERDNEENARTLYSFNLLTPNSIEVYCFKNGSTYTLYRQ